MKALKKLLIFILLVILIVFVMVFVAIFVSTSSEPLPYIDLIEEYSEKYDVDEKLLASLISVESNFRAEAESPAGAKGLMQVLPETAEWISDHMGIEYEPDRLYEPEYNINLGTYYFKYLINHFKSVDYAILAYNGGMGNVDNWIKSGALDEEDDYSGVDIGETQNYIKKVKNTKALYDVIYEDVLKAEDMSRLSRSWKIFTDLLAEIFK